MGATGTATLDFGAFPGTTDAIVTVTGQSGIVSGSLVEAWILPADTAVHTIDEHILLASMIDIVAGNVVAGVGFTIYAVARDMGGSPLVHPGAGRNHAATLNGAAAAHTNRPELFPSVGGQTINTVWGTVNVAWVWN